MRRARGGAWWAIIEEGVWSDNLKIEIDLLINNC
jgi:hypothetical protein